MNIMPKNSKSITKLSKYYLLERYSKQVKIANRLFFKFIKHLFHFWIGIEFGRLVSTTLWHTWKSSTKIVILQYHKTNKNQHNY